METKISNILIDVVSIKINGKKLTNNFLAQLPFIDVHTWVDEYVDINNGRLSEYEYRIICQMDKMSCVKHYKDRLKVEAESSYIYNTQSDINYQAAVYFRSTEAMVVWQTPDGRLALHRLIKGEFRLPDEFERMMYQKGYSSLCKLWKRELEEFAQEAREAPLAMVGV